MPSLRRDSQSGQTMDHPSLEQSHRRPSQTSQKWQEVALRSEEVRQYRLEEADANLPNMFQRLRRNSKQVFLPSSSSSKGRRSASIADDGLAPSMEYLHLGRGKLTFFDLPPEIRNVIYEDVASSTSLQVSCVLPRRKGKEPRQPPPTTPHLLLVSKQARLEYLPLLLERAAIVFAVRDFDFRNLMRVSNSLYSSELKALRKNPRLTVRLLATKPTKDTLAALRRWAQRRTEDMYTLPLAYALQWPSQRPLVPPSGSVQRINTYIQRRGVLQQNLAALAALGREVPEALAWELQPVAEAFERELVGLGGRQGDRNPWGGEQWIMPILGGR